MATFFLGGGDEAPASAQVDLSPLFNGSICPNIPVWISFAYWIVTEDVLALGAFTADINYIDPTGTNRVINGSPISLAAAGGFFSRPVEMVVRQDLSSAFTFDKQLISTAGSSVIGYRLFLTGVLDEITSGF